MRKTLLCCAALGCCFIPLARPQDQIAQAIAKTSLQAPPVFTSVPARSQGTGGGCSFTGPFLRIQSKTAGSEGLVVRVSPPSKGGYAEGAPIVDFFEVKKELPG